MRKLLTSLSGVAYGDGVTNGVWEIDLLTAGGLAFFESDGALIDGAIPVVTTPDFFVALGRDTVGADKSVLIDRASLSYNKYAYAAARAKIMLHGDDGTTGNELAFPTIVAGQVYGYDVTNASMPVEDLSRFKFPSVTAVTGDTSSTIVAKLVLAVNADTDRPCTALAVNVNDGILFTAVTAGIDFKVTPSHDMKTLVTGMLVESADSDVTHIANQCVAAIIDGEYYDGSTTTTLLSKYGHTPALLVITGYEGEGTSAQILATEVDYSTTQGNINARRMISELWEVPSQVVTGQTYTSYVLEWTAPNTSVNIGQLDGNGRQLLLIAVPSGDAAAILAVDNILAVI